MSGHTLDHRIELPDSFRIADFLAFYKREGRSVTERVTQTGMEKALLWQDQVAILNLTFGGPKTIQASLGVPNPPHPDERIRFERWLERILGLGQPVSSFEKRWRHHTTLGDLLSKQSGLRLSIHSSPFEAITWAIMGQQVSTAAALTLRRRLLEYNNIRHEPSGLLCHPSA